MQGGEWLFLSDNWQVQVLHTPGHSAGHLTLYDPSHRCAFIGDAVLGRGQDMGDDQISFPFYTDVDGYLSTIETLRALPIDKMLSSHFPMMERDEMVDFLDTSAALAQKIDQTILNAFRGGDKPFNWEDLARHVGVSVGGYSLSVSLLHTVYAHYQRLVRLGYI